MRSADLQLVALETPERLGFADAGACLDDLRSGEPTARRRGIGALAALGYGRPDLLAPAHLEALLAPAAAPAPGALAATLMGLLDGPLGPQIAARMPNVERVVGLPAILREKVLRLAVCWWPAEIRLGALVAGVEATSSAEERDHRVATFVEPLLDRDPSRVTPELLARLVALLETTPRVRHTLHRIASRHEVPEALRAVARAVAVPRFPYAEEAARVFGRPGFHLLVVQGLRIGQGDEILRLGAVLDGLLAAFPRLEATVVTPRPYLYDHPRVTALATGGAAAAAALAGPWDGLFAIDEPAVPTMRLVPAFFDGLAARVAAEPPAFLFVGTTLRNHIVCRRLFLGGRELADRLGLDRLDVESAYDTSRRLLAELGLPDLLARPPGEPRPNALVGGASPEALAAWARLAGAGNRPVALVSPFGGAGATKGFGRERLGDLAVELAGLVEEGYRAVVLPPGTPWVPPEALAELVGHLPAAARPHVAIAPDPAGADDGDPVPREPAGFSRADRVMRSFLAFAAQADLLVSVEGWLAHLGVRLGKPVRLVLMAGSYLPEWYPPGDVVSASRLSALAPPPDDRLAPDRPPPLPRLHPKFLLEAALRSLGEAGDLRAPALLLRALDSADAGVRLAAAEGLAAFREDAAVQQRLLAGLEDEDHWVRAAAARGLLGVALEVRSAGFPPEPVLRAHDAIARQQWLEVARLGAAALPALAVAVRGSDETIRREARWTMAALMKNRLPGAVSRPGPARPGP